MRCAGWNVSDDAKGAIYAVDDESFLKLRDAELMRMRRACRATSFNNANEEYALRAALEAITEELQARSARRWNLLILAVAAATLLATVVTLGVTLWPAKGAASWFTG
jgi:hypothetical protein